MNYSDLKRFYDEGSGAVVKLQGEGLNNKTKYKIFFVFLKVLESLEEKNDE